MYAMGCSAALLPATTLHACIPSVLDASVACPSAPPPLYASRGTGPIALCIQITDNAAMGNMTHVKDYTELCSMLATHA